MTLEQLTGDVPGWLDVCRDRGLPLVIYGMGNGADKLLSVLADNGLAAADFMASDAFVRGQTFHGVRVKTYREICAIYPDFILLVAFGSRLPEVLDNLSEIAAEHTLLVPDLPVVGEEIFTPAYAQAHKEALTEAYEALADDTSRAVFSSLIRAKISGDLEELLKEVQTKVDIMRLFDRENIKTYVDFGAYDGDTIKEAAAFFPHLSYAVGVEADPRTFRKLSAYADSAGFPVRAVHAAVSDQNGSAFLHGSANRNTSLYAASHEAKNGAVPTVTADDLLEGIVPDLIKMDVEGAEAQALRGGLSMLQNCRPALKIAVYHRTEDLFSILLFLKSHLCDYQFYLRRTRCVPAWEADLLAIPGGKT